MQAVRETLDPPYDPGPGKEWQIWLPQYEAHADGADALARSTLKLFEDGVPLGPAHAEHADVQAKGAGAYSHWLDFLRFSTSDGGDPNTNGRTYEIVLED
ncbi:hypothetical protein BH09PSE2_BH09PSE2_02180 [soil metagenome]